MASKLVDDTVHVCNGIICLRFEYIKDCITCAEYDLDIIIPGKICNFFITELQKVKVTHFLGLEGVLLCEGSKEGFQIICVLSSEIIKNGNPFVLVITEWCSVLCVCFQCLGVMYTSYL